MEEIKGMRFSRIFHLDVWCDSANPRTHDTLLHRLSLRVFLTAFGLVALSAGAHAAGSGRISDFMTMDGCVGANGALTAAIPGDSTCGQHRDIKPGEVPLYKLQNFPAAASGCALGGIAKINVPVVKGDNTRIVSSTTRQAGCRAKSGQDDDDGSRNGASIQWYDDSYGFIMGSYSPVGLSSFESDQCLQDAQSSRRFFRGWVIGPAEVPALGVSGYGVFPSKLTVGKASDIASACAKRYNNALTTWVVNPFEYKSGRQFVSLVSSHYSRGSLNGKNPGEAMQMEQTYWTRELGLSRWEKWAREDWVNPRSKMPALALAQALYQAGRCSSPISRAIKFNAEMEVPAAQSPPGVYARTIKNAVTGEQHIWYMTLCEDYTNLAPTPNSGNPVAPISGLADDAYWR